ncbi:MAG: phosphoribosyltransferase family protein [bacterium]|nr:phosphoribosyltransferase family protein [bacterium]
MLERPKKNDCLLHLQQTIVADLLLETEALRLTPTRIAHHDIDPSAPISPYFLDLSRMSTSSARQEIANAFSLTMFGVRTDLLAPIPLTAVPFVTTLSDNTGIPLIIPRTEKKTHGGRGAINGIYQRGQKVILFDDVMTRGTSKELPIFLLEGAGLEITSIIVLIDREEGGMERFQKMGFDVRAFLKISDLLTYYEHTGQIPENALRPIWTYLFNL